MPQYLRNMLDGGMNLDDEVDRLECKQELTVEDLDLMIENAEKLKHAAINARSTLLTK